MFKPRYYQQEAVDALYTYFSKNKGNPVIAQPTGTGKSVVISTFIKGVYKKYPRQRMMMITHVKELIEQNFDKLIKSWPTAPAGIYSAGLKRRDTKQKIIFAGIQSIAKKAALFGHMDLLIIDEAHLVSPKDETNYFKFIAELTLVNPYLKVIGLTATPYRLGLGLLTNGNIFTDICYDNTTLEGFNRLIDEGFLSPLIPKAVQNEIAVEGVGKSGGEFITSQLQKAVDKQEITYEALKETIECGHDRNHWLIFGTGVEHCDHIADMLDSLGVSAVSVHSKKSAKENARSIADFKAGRVRALVNNNKLTTGFDFPNIDLIAMIRHTCSPGLWCLDEDTEILTPSGFKGVNEIAIGDPVVGFEEETRELIPTIATGYIHRDLLEDEKLLKYSSRQFMFSMTDTHNVLYEQRVGNGQFKLRKEQLKNLTSKANRRMLTSTITKMEGMEVDNQLLVLFGLFLSDGSFDKSNNTLIIYQSERYLTVCEEIEQVLTSLNLCWRKYEKEPKTQFATVFKLRRYAISRTVRDPNKLGWSNYFSEDDFNKELPNRFKKCNRTELKNLLYGINLGDGCKYQCPSIYWKPKTLSISTGNKAFADNLQILCIYNGYSCRIKETTNVNGNLLYRLYIRDSLNITFNKECLEQSTNDGKVWCIENPTGNLVTRYKGQVLITGNCQMLGRGTRPVYADGYDLTTVAGRLAAMAASEKQNCLVLDFAGNTKRLGPINDPLIPRKKGQSKGVGVAPIRMCKECRTINHASVSICINCGFEFPKGVNIYAQASSNDLIAKSGFQIEVFEVTKVIYTVHTKPDKPDAICVTYYSGLNKRFKEWVCLEHQSFASKKARDWWRLRDTKINDPVPETTGEALCRVNNLKEPTHIRVWVNKKYPEIMAYSFDGGFE